MRAGDEGQAALEGHEQGAHLATLPPDDPRLQPFAKHPGRAEKVVVACFLAALACFMAFGAAYWVNAREEVLGGTIGAGLFFFGFGFTAWGKYLMARGPFMEERHVLHSDDAARDAFDAALVERGAAAIGRRSLLTRLLAAAGGVAGVAAAFPLIRSLGPLPKGSLFHTQWRKGSLVVTIDGRPVTVDDLEIGGVLTVFPAGAEGSAISQTLLVRLADTPIVTGPGKETWGPQGYVAYSKVCTHAGCPVGLFEHQVEKLLCPCHQSLFDIAPRPTGTTYYAAEPVFGPAPRPLPQLALRVDAKGRLRAQHDYDQPIGPGFWERTTT